MFPSNDIACFIKYSSHLASFISFTKVLCFTLLDSNSFFVSLIQSCLTLWHPMDYSTPGFPVLLFLLELAQIHVPWVGDAIQPSHPLLSPSPPALNLSQNQGLSNESILCIRWPRYWSFSLSISPSHEYSGLISFRTYWFDLAVQGTLKSIL